MHHPIYRFIRPRSPQRALAVIGFAGLLATGPVSWADPAPVATPAASSGSPRGTQGALNPDVSLDGLFALSQFSRDNPLVFDGGHDPKVTGFNIQQVELTFGSNVDPYFRADANLVMTGDGTIEVEEAYATTLDLPGDLQLKAGQFLTAFGRHNPTHPHAWAWANQPLVLGRFFGGDGLRNPGAQVSWLTPLPWYAELIGSAQNSTGDTATSFNPGGSMRTLGDALYLLRWNNFFSATESFSINAGASYAQGLNRQGPGQFTRIAGVDLYLKYRPVESLGYLSLQAEALQRYYDSPGGQLRDWGWYAELDWRLAEPRERWHAGVRFDYVGPKNVPVVTSRTYGGDDPDTSTRYRVSPVVTFYPSEFSKLRLQYDYDKPQSFDSAQHVAIVELEFLIGAHGAHKF